MSVARELSQFDAQRVCKELRKFFPTLPAETIGAFADELVRDRVRDDDAMAGARLMVRETNYPTLAEFFRCIKQAREDRQERERLAVKPVAALPAPTGLPRTRASNIARDIAWDILARLMPADDFDAEMRVRLALTDEAIEQRRREMRALRRPQTSEEVAP